jgi:uncharacterized protein (TIGR03382 family)
MSRRWLGLLLLLFGMWIGTGAVAQAAVTIDNNPIALGTVLVGATATGTGFLTSDAGADEDVVISLDTGCGDFAITSDPTIILREDVPAIVSIRLIPASAGPKDCRVEVRADDNGTPLLLSFRVTATGVIPALISISPTPPVIFADTEVGRTSVARTLTATNIGGTPLSITSAAFQTGAGDYARQAGVSAITLQPNASTTWDIACTPSARGPRNGTFRILSNSSIGATSDVALQCNGLQGEVATSQGATVINFGDVQQGQNVPRTFTLRNDGNIAIRNLTATLSSTTQGYVFNTAAVPTAIAASGSTLLTVAFAPLSGDDGGPATITFTGVWGTSNTVTTTVVSLNGNGLGVSFATSPTVSFGNFRFDARPTATYQITNTGDGMLDIESAAFTPAMGTQQGEVAFTFRRGTTVVQLPETLTVGQVLEVTAVAQPSNRIGAVAGTVLVKSANLAATDRTVTITGTATSAAVTATATTDFGAVDVDGEAQTQMITITNTGDAVLDIPTLAAGSVNPAFTLTLPATPTTLAIGASLTIPVSYKPTVEHAPASFDEGVLVAGLTGVVGVTQAMMSVRGRGIDRHVALPPEPPEFPLTFPNQDTAPIAVTVSNTGEAPLMITSAAISPASEWELVGASQVAIPGLGSHDFMVRFTPTIAGASEGELTLSTDDNDHPTVTVPLFAGAVFAAAEGGGGCQAGGDPRGGALVLGVLALVALAVLGRPRRRHAGPAFAAALIAISPAAHADDLDITVFDPTPATTSAGFHLQSPDVGADGSWGVSSIVSHASELLVLRVRDPGGDQTRDAVVARSSLLQLGGAYAFLGRFEVGAHLPLYNQRGEDAAGLTEAVSGSALGNLSLHGKVRLWRAGPLTAGVSATLVLPTATAGQFVGSSKPEAQLLALGAFVPAQLDDRLAIRASAGPVLRGTSRFANVEQASGVAWGFGTSYRLLDGLWATAEIFGEMTPSALGATPSADAMATATTLSQIEGLLGAQLRVDRRLTVGVAVGRGLTNAIGTPDLRGVLSLAFVPAAPALAPIRRSEPPRREVDSDGDGLLDSADRCARQPEDRDQFEDGDGCPDPDNDADGVADAGDRCPLEPEDKDGFQDSDGCRDPDNDGDGIADAQDRCATAAETVNGNEDDDGCPDEDDVASIGAGDPRSPVKAAEDTWAKGRELMKQNRYPEACAAFEQSQQLDPQFGTQYNLAGCYEKVGKLATARNLYRELGRADTNPTRRARSRQFAAALDPRVPKIKLVLARAPKDVQVQLNRVDASALLGVETPVDVGSYEIVASAPRYREWRQAIRVHEEGKVVTVTIELERLP